MPYIGNTIRAADDYRLIDDISSGFNGSETSFALQVAGSAPVPFPKSPQQVLISVNGVIQEPDPTGASGFNLVGTNIVFSSAPTNGHAFFGIIYATADYLNSGGNFPSGSLGAPSITFVGDEDTGIYRKGSGSVAFVADSTEIANTDSNGLTISSGSLIIPGDIIHAGDTNTKIRFSDADQIKLETGSVQKLRLDNSEVVVNDDGADVNFRVEGDTEPNLLFVDASADQVSIGTSSPSDVFDVVHAANAAAGISIRNTNNSQGSAIAQLLVSGGDNAKGRVKIETNGAFHTIDEDSNGNLIIEDNGTERFRVTASGNILPGADSAYNIGSNATRFANGYFDTLYGNGSNLTGISSDLVNDTSPQLGGNLASNGNNIIMADNDEIIVGSSNDLIIRHIPGSRHEILGAASAQLQVRCDEVLFLSENGTEDLFRAVKDGAFKAYHDANLRFETRADGCKITGSATDGRLIIASAGDVDLFLQADTDNSDETHNPTIHFQQDGGGTNMKIGVEGSAGTTFSGSGGNTPYVVTTQGVNLQFGTDSVIRWQVTSSGHFNPLANNTYDIGNTSQRVRNIYTNDLHLSNEGSSNDVDSTWGDYTIQEGFEDLYLINNRTGKKFKFNLTEVS